MFVCVIGSSHLLLLYAAVIADEISSAEEDNDYDYRFDNILEVDNGEDHCETTENWDNGSSDSNDSAESNDGDDDVHDNVEMKDADEAEGSENIGIATRLHFFLILFFRIVFHFQISKHIQDPCFYIFHVRQVTQFS